MFEYHFEIYIIGLISGRQKLKFYHLNRILLKKHMKGNGRTQKSKILSTKKKINHVVPLPVNGKNKMCDLKSWS